jgi:anti-anti-sigma factor
MRQRQHAPLFRVEIEPERGRVRVIPHGELDLLTVEALRAQVNEPRSSGNATIVLDLRQLSFMDSTGLRLLLALDAAARCDGSTSSSSTRTDPSVVCWS